MKKFSIAAVALVLVLGISYMNANSATYKEAINKETRLTGKNSKGTETGRVSALTMKKFNQNFGSVTNTVWEKSKSLDKVTFVKGGTKKVAYYNSSSRLVGTGSTGSASGIPLQTMTDLKSQYKDYTVGSVIFFDRNESNAISKLVYGTQLKEENYLVELTSNLKTIVVQVKVKGGSAVIDQI